MSNTKFQSPLNDNHLQIIKNNLDALNFARQEIDKAKRAGIDVSKQEADWQDAYDKLLRLKNVYFPNT